MAYESDVAIVLRREDFIKLRKAYLKFHEDHPKTSWDEARVFGTPHAEIHEAETDDGPKVVIHWKRIEWYQGEFGAPAVNFIMAWIRACEFYEFHCLGEEADDEDYENRGGDSGLVEPEHRLCINV